MTQKQKILSVIIPVYNEEKTVVSLLDKVMHSGVTVSLELIIVNDGSTDSSPELIQNWIREQKRNASNIVFLNKENGGKGSAVKAGIQASTGDVVIIQDADLEYDPHDYEACIRPILDGECKVVYGSREEENRNRLYSSPSFYLGGLLLTFWINLLYNANLTDEPTCYKTFDGPLIRSLPIEGDRFEWEPEVTAKLLRMGFEIREVPVSYYPRKITEGKKIKWKDGAACCIVLASGGYPVKYQSGYPISGLEEAGKLATVFHAGTKLGEDGSILTAGGRVLGVTAVGEDLEDAIQKSYAACKPISFQDMHFRTDIGKV